MFWKKTAADPRAAATATKAPPAPNQAAATLLPAFELPPAGVSLQRSFTQDGFIVFPGLFDRDEMTRYRKAALAHFGPTPPVEPRFSGTAYFDDPFRTVFRNRQLIQSLRAILGDDFVFVNEFALHDSHYVGWHTDTVSPDGKGGHEFHWSPGFCVVQVAIYLQDNGLNGGGLDVVPRSHMCDDLPAAALRRERGHPVHNRMPPPAEDPTREAVTIQSRLGDVVAFHFRTNHRASQPRGPVPRTNDRKLAMFFVAGLNNLPTRQYRAWLDEYDAMLGTKRPPVPDDFRALVKETGHDIV